MSANRYQYASVALQDLLDLTRTPKPHGSYLSMEPEIQALRDLLAEGYRVVHICESRVLMEKEDGA